MKEQINFKIVVILMFVIMAGLLAAGCGALSPAAEAAPGVQPTQAAKVKVTEVESAAPPQAEAYPPPDEGEATPSLAEGQESSPPDDAAESPEIEYSDDDAQRAIQLFTAQDDVAAFLADYPDWQGESWPEDDAGQIWGIDLYSEAADEWLGWGQVNVSTGEVIEYFVPRDLSPEEFQAGLEKVEKYVFADAEILALLGDPEAWDHETRWNRWEANWEVWFGKGLDEWLVVVYLEDDYASLEIIDPTAFEAEEQERLNRDQAIELAWEAEGIGEALDGVDYWTTYVENQGGSQWSVSFVSGDTELFYALVDIESWEVLESTK